jgi:hypothetical protein
MVQPIAISDEYKNILCAAAKANGRLLLLTNDSGEWFVECGTLRLPEKQSPLQSAKVRTAALEMKNHGLLKFEGEPGHEDGVYTVTVKGFEVCGITE